MLLALHPPVLAQAGSAALGEQVLAVKLLAQWRLTSNPFEFIAQLSSPQATSGGRWKTNLKRGVRELPVISNLG